MSQNNKRYENLISLCKRRGFVFQSSEIYGGLASVYDYGPLGIELKKLISDAWWNHFVRKNTNIVGIDSQILMHPTVWEASGHVEGFHDPLVDCKSCNSRFRTDHLIEDKDNSINADSLTNDQMDQKLIELSVNCPNCGAFNWTKTKNFNLLMETHLGALEGDKDKVYLRGETAQGQFVMFKNIMDSTRVQVPFGIAQIGKAFRNEITKGKFIFRTLEFEQMEIEYFIKESTWEKDFEDWRSQIETWYTEILGISKDKFTWKPHHPDKLAHYAKKAEDYEFDFDWGYGEVSGLHYRTDFDLSTHQKHSNKKLEIYDSESKEKFIPHVVEATFGLNRNLLMVLDNYYVEEEDRVLLKLPDHLAPYEVAVFPLVKNKPELVDLAKKIFDYLIDNGVRAYWDDRGNIGKRYLYQDEMGTPKCITVDYESLEDDSITIRDRDSRKQKRVKISDL
jgi:glycyl-tRNA synthetase